MKITEIVNFFHSLNIEELNVRSNKDMHSVWLTYCADLYPSQSLYGIHTRSPSNSFILRLYYCSDVKTRITIQCDSVNSLRYTTHGDKDEILEDLLIQNFDELGQSEEYFFQNSLIHNYGDMNYDCFVKLKDILNKSIEVTKKVLSE